VEGSKVDFVLDSEAPAPAGYPACGLTQPVNKASIRKSVIVIIITFSFHF
jgi:hypothetical protein